MLRRCRRSATGFTLIEILIVLTIMGIMLSFAPSLLAGIPSMRLRSASAEMANTLRRLHDDALRSGIPASFVLDPAHLRFATASRQIASAPKSLPAVVDAASLTTASPVRPGDESTLTFFPDGSATAATLRLLHGDRVQTLHVDWLTGRVDTDG